VPTRKGYTQVHTITVTDKRVGGGGKFSKLKYVPRESQRGEAGALKFLKTLGKGKRGGEISVQECERSCYDEYRKNLPLYPTGLIEVNARIPLTKSLHLEEAENLVRRPKRGAVIFPLRAQLPPPSSHTKAGDPRQAHHKKLENGRKGIVIPKHAPKL
jgi:hypothetical protein